MDEKTVIIVNDEPTRITEPKPSPLMGLPAEPETIALPAEPLAPAPEEAKFVKKPGQAKKKISLNPSRFDGYGPTYFFLNLGCLLLLLVTLGITLPWCLSWMARYEAAHTYVNGRRFVFDGRGSQLIGKWLFYILLFIVTGSVFGFWIPKKIKNWKVSHLRLLEETAPSVLTSSAASTEF